MTKKKDMTAAKLKKAKADNAVVYKSMIALALLCVGLFGLRALRSYYSTVAGFDLLYPLSTWIAVAGLVILLGCAVGMFLSKKNIAQMLLPWGIVFGLIAGATGLAMRLSWTEDFGALYFLVCFLMLEYVILQLYRWEFFLFSLATSVAGFQFYQMSTGFAWNVWNIVLLVITALVLVGTFLTVRGAARNHGLLVFGKNRVLLLPAKSNPALIYVAVILWVVLIAASLFLGGLFAYYCMFAAIAVEFIAAVYYTFQLN